MITVAVTLLHVRNGSGVCCNLSYECKAFRSGSTVFFRPSATICLRTMSSWGGVSCVCVGGEGSGITLSHDSIRWWLDGRGCSALTLIQRLCLLLFFFMWRCMAVPFVWIGFLFQEGWPKRWQKRFCTQRSFHLGMCSTSKYLSITKRVSEIVFVVESGHGRTHWNLSTYLLYSKRVSILAFRKAPRICVCGIRACGGKSTEHIYIENIFWVFFGTERNTALQNNSVAHFLVGCRCSDRQHGAYVVNRCCIDWKENKGLSSLDASGKRLLHLFKPRSEAAYLSHDAVLSSSSLSS